ncbi:hypothetical protein PRIPAC_90976, partial [Pristionchus pacificus]|uniref:Uncharacterized protein n=1 Tax=Pristionchus pacificus TaxID=54126 RepID=A0A2A6B659_PRIPA
AQKEMQYNQQMNAPRYYQPMSYPPPPPSPTTSPPSPTSTTSSRPSSCSDSSRYPTSTAYCLSVSKPNLPPTPLPAAIPPPPPSTSQISGPCFQSTLEARIVARGYRNLGKLPYSSIPVVARRTDN